MKGVDFNEAQQHEGGHEIETPEENEENQREKLAGEPTSATPTELRQGASEGEAVGAGAEGLPADNPS